MANRHRQEMRNTTTERQCPHCKGAGEVIRNDTNPYGYGPDPQCDEPVTCDYPGCHHGWVRCVPMDPAEQLRNARILRRMFPNRYGETRQRLVSPVLLPDSNFTRDEARRDAA